VSFAPVQPSGWPSAIAPPFTFTLSGSSDSSRITGRDCAANASFSSTRSTRLSFIRSRFMSFGIAAIGPIPITSGATPATGEPEEARQRFHAELLQHLFRDDDRDGRAVAHLGGVPRRHRPLRVEGGLELRQRLDRRVGARTVVRVVDDLFTEERAAVLLLEQHRAHRDDLLPELAIPDRRERLAVAMVGELVLILPRHLVPAGDLLAVSPIGR